MGHCFGLHILRLGAFIGERPILFNKRHFKRVYRNSVPEAVLGDSTCLPDEFKTLL